jgi:F-type H+-transporting ATPase subunit epsilon
MSYKLDLLTPQGQLVRGFECVELLIPTTMGQINVLPNHTHLLSKLDTGILTVKTSDNKFHHYSIITGVAKLMGDKISILSKLSESRSSIDIKRAESALERAQDKLSGKDVLSDTELIKHQRKLERAKMRIKLAYLGE